MQQFSDIHDHSAWQRMWQRSRSRLCKERRWLHLRWWLRRTSGRRSRHRRHMGPLRPHLLWDRGSGLRMRGQDSHWLHWHCCFHRHHPVPRRAELLDQDEDVLWSYEIGVCLISNVCVIFNVIVSSRHSNIIWPHTILSLDVSDGFLLVSQCFLFLPHAHMWQPPGFSLSKSISLSLIIVHFIIYVSYN